MTTIAILFLAILLLGGTIVAACVVKGALTKSPFRPRKTDHDKARHMARAILKRI